MDDIIKEIKDLFRTCYDAEDENYTQGISDLNFLKGDQWPSDLKSQREADGRPCLVINKLQVFADQVIGDIRQNEPSVKIKPVDSQADPEIAEILNGLIRNIEVQNDAEIAYDTAAESAVQCGIGAWRIGTDYADDDQFEQDITISRIINPFTIYWGPGQRWDKSDAKFCFVTEKLFRDEFKRQYPKASLLPFEGGKDTNFFWGDDKFIRLVEYWKKEPTQKTLYLVQQIDPATGRPTGIFQTEMKPDLEKLGPGWQVLREDKRESYKIKWWKANMSEILEGPTDWPSKYIPIVMLWGKELNIEGKTFYRGIVRNSRDAQRLYNYSRSTGAEVISLAPKAPYLITSKMLGQYKTLWDQAGKKAFPYLPYEADPGAPGLRPTREPPIVANTGISQEVMISDQEMHDTTGLQLASLGKKSNEKSGRAIMARQKEGDVANFPFYDNLGRAMKYSGKVILDLIPKIYDTPRIIRILNKDGSDQHVPINQPVPGLSKIYDLTLGKYDVVVSIGPSYTTQREEAAQNIMLFLQSVPAAGPLIADLLAKYQDWPGAQEIEKRLKLLLPPQLQQAPGGGPMPQPPPPPPDPEKMLAVKKAEAEAQGAALDTEKKFHEIQRLKATPLPTQGESHAGKK
jgi:hypothetical protein